MADVNVIPVIAMNRSYVGETLVDTMASFIPKPLTCLSGRFVNVMVFLMLGMLTGCSSTPTTVSDQDVATTKISVATYRRIDQDIWDASVSARIDAEAYARYAVQQWAEKVWGQTVKSFIPWYVDYWTQEGLFIKFAWYQLIENDDTAAATERLAAHLQEQFSERVLEPVALETDPDRITDKSAALYTSVLANQIRVIPDRYQIPLAAFHGKLKVVPAIELSIRPVQNVSLYEILTADDIAGMPAYKNLSTRNYSSADGSAFRSTRSKLDAVAQRTADKLAGKIVLRGGGTAAAAIAGGGLGVVISAGFTAWSMIEYEKERPSLEAELRENLWMALNETTHILLEDRDRGVLAAVHHMSTNIENHVRSAPFVDQLMEEDPPGNSEDVDSLF